MNKLLVTLSFLISIFCLTSHSWALSKCKGEKKSSFWNNCIGKITYSSGTTYFGAFKDNLPNGYGEYNRLDGGSYRGYSKNGLLHGQGIHIYMPYGSSYSGEWKNNKFDGKGIFKPGAKFVEGTWSNGHGTLLIHNNLPLKGLFRDGKFVDTNKLTKTSNSKIEEYKNFCSEIGFTPGTEKFGECVVEAMKKG